MNVPQGSTIRYFGDYEIQSELGRGGMGIVYRARQITLNRPVALKMIKAGILADDSELERFQKEAEAVALLDHPGIVPIYEVGEYDGQSYFSMKLVEGGNLADRMGSFRENSKAVATLMIAMAQAVHHAHMRGILHRDLKPLNILIDHHGHPHVTDFGLAKRVENDVELTPSGAFVGTPAYMSPEQVQSHRGSMTTATDVYGLGAIFYALLTGKAPFGGKSVIETLDSVRSHSPERPRKINARVPADLETICLKCLEKEPSRRYSSAQALIDDLENWVESRPITARRVGLAERACLACKRRPAVATLSAAVVLALIVGTVAVIIVQTRANGLLEGQKNDLIVANSKIEQVNSELRGANILLDRQRLRAEDREAQAINAVKRFRDAIASEPELKNTPVLSLLRIRLLREPLAFFRALRNRLQADGESRPESLDRLAQSSFELGNLSYEIGDKQDALNAYREALAILENRAKAEPASVPVQDALAALFTRMGVLLSETGKPNDALNAYQSSLQIRQKMADANPSDPERQRGIATCYHNIAAVLKTIARPAETLKFHESALRIQRKLAEANPTDAQLQCDVAASQSNLGSLLRATGRLPEALEAQQSALAIFQKLTDADPTNTAFQLKLGQVHLNLGVLFNDLGKLAESLKAFQATQTVLRKLADANPTNIQFRSGLAASYLNSGNILMYNGKETEALKAYESALATYGTLADANPTVTEFQRNRGSCHYNIGNLLTDMGQLDNAYKSHQSGLTIRQKLVDANPSVIQFQSDLAESHYKIGTLQVAQGQPEAAMKSFESARRIAQKLADANPTIIQFQNQLGEYDESIGQLQSASGKPGEARKALESAMVIWRKLTEDHPQSPVYASSRARTLHHLAVLDLNAHQFDAARTRLREAVQWQRKAQASSPANPSYRRFLTNHLTKLVDAARGLGDADGVSEAERELADFRHSNPESASPRLAPAGTR
jgi:tetratricopeptide (TPR) repeat protein